MKTAEEWIDESLDIDKPPRTQFDIVKAIQLDAYKQGMTDAAMMIPVAYSEQRAILTARQQNNDMSADKEYLGDSVYADIEGGMIKLTTENGFEPSNTIYLELEVLDAFERYIERIKQKYAPKSK